MKRFLIVFFLCTLFLFFPKTAYAECDNPTAEIIPTKISTSQTLTARVTVSADCTNDSIILLIETPPGGNRQETLIKAGNVYVNDRISLPINGTYQAYGISVGISNVKQFPTPITITVADPTPPPGTTATPAPTNATGDTLIACGQNTTNGRQCPANCPPDTDPQNSGQFICGGAKAKYCKDDSVITSECDTNYQLKDPTDCSDGIQSRHMCKDINTILCEAHGSFYCQTTDRKKQVAPTPPCANRDNGKCTSFTTALGNIDTDPIEFIKRIFGILLGLAGGIAVIRIIISGYQLMTSGGNKESVQGARDKITSAIVGLLFLIFSLVILQIIGVDILSIPGFKAE